MKKNRLILFFVVLLVFITSAYIYGESEDTEYEAYNKSLTRISAEVAMANPDYLVTVGDIYSLNYLARSTPVSYKIVVDISYKIRVSNLATINARGLTFSQLKRQVENIVAKNYPFSGVQFIMLAPGSFPVRITGEVTKSDEVIVNSLSRLSSVVKPFFTRYSSIRNIEVINSSGKKKTYDIFLASARGEFSQDPYLRPGSTIKVNRLKRSVSILGAVERPGTYQLLDGENLNDLINVYANGPTEFADLSEVLVKRFVKVDGKPLGSSMLVNNATELESFQLKNNDRVYIEDNANLRGVVYFEGSLDIEPKLASKDDLIEKKDTVLKDTVLPVEFLQGDDLLSVLREKRALFSRMSDTKNAYLMRNGKKIYENFNRIFFDPDYNEKILLKSGDRIVVPFLQQTVTVVGAVMNPGSYPYVPGKTYEYYIGLAGGFDESRNVGASVYVKDSAGNYMSDNEHILPGASVIAKSNSFTYNFNKWAPVIATTISIISITLTIITFAKK